MLRPEKNLIGDSGKRAHLQPGRRLHGAAKFDFTVAIVEEQGLFILVSSMLAIAELPPIIIESRPGRSRRAKRLLQLHAETGQRLFPLELARRCHARATEGGCLRQTAEEINRFPLLLKLRELVVSPTLSLERLPRGVKRDGRAAEPDKVRNLGRFRFPGRDQAAQS